MLLFAIHSSLFTLHGVIMVWYIIAGILFAIAIGILIYSRMRDRRYEKLKPSEAMSEEMWEEIEEEREAALTRREKFTEALNEAEEKGEKG